MTDRNPYVIRERQNDILYDTDAFEDLLPEFTNNTKLWYIKMYGDSMPNPLYASAFVLADTEEEVRDLIETTAKYLSKQNLGGFETLKQITVEDTHKDSLKAYVKHKLVSVGTNKLVWRRDDGKPEVLGHGSDWISLPKDETRAEW